eukprot:3012770-Amphidinium_carterae.1
MRRGVAVLHRKEQLDGCAALFVSSIMTSAFEDLRMEDVATIDALLDSEFEAVVCNSTTQRTNALESGCVRQAEEGDDALEEVIAVVAVFALHHQLDLNR